MATALRSLASSVHEPAYPSVVTVASCDSGNRGNVVYSGASFAHELHQAGIPFVVASQFPLSKPGSVHMVEVLYDRLLWGDDPREVLHALRRKLYALHTSTTHDWASLVVYCALPTTRGDQLKDTAYGQARAAIDAALGPCDDFVDSLRDAETTPAPEALRSHVEELLDRAAAAAKRMPTGGEYETEGYGLLASTEKRKAEVRFRLGQVFDRRATSKEDAAALFAQSVTSLRNAQTSIRPPTNRTWRRVPARSRRSGRCTGCSLSTCRSEWSCANRSWKTTGWPRRSPPKSTENRTTD